MLIIITNTWISIKELSGFNISNPVVKMLLHNFNKIAILQIIYVVECFYFIFVET